MYPKAELSPVRATPVAGPRVHLHERWNSRLHRARLALPADIGARWRDPAMRACRPRSVRPQPPPGAHRSSPAPGHRHKQRGRAPRSSQPDSVCGPSWIVGVPGSAGKSAWRTLSAPTEVRQAWALRYSCAPPKRTSTPAARVCKKSQSGTTRAARNRVRRWPCCRPATSNLRWWST